MGEEQPYYAKLGVVWKRSAETRWPDGSTSIAAGYPICIVHQFDGPDSAEAIAELMNRGTALADQARECAA